MARRVCDHRSERLRSKDQRRKAKAALRRGDEPQPEYRSGKFWTD